MLHNINEAHQLMYLVPKMIKINIKNMIKINKHISLTEGTLGNNS